MTEEQKKALKILERAFKKCSKAGLQFAGMDGNIFYANEKSINNLPEPTNKTPYNEVARVAEEGLPGGGYVNHHGTYIDSGGW